MLAIQARGRKAPIDAHPLAPVPANPVPPPAFQIHRHLLYLPQNHVLLFMMRPWVADQLTATADSLSSRPQMTFPCSSIGRAGGC